MGPRNTATSPNNRNAAKVLAGFGLRLQVQEPRWIQQVLVPEDVEQPTGQGRTAQHGRPARAEASQETRTRRDGHHAEVPDGPSDPTQSREHGFWGPRRRRGRACPRSDRRSRRSRNPECGPPGPSHARDGPVRCRSGVEGSRSKEAAETLDQVNLPRLRHLGDPRYADEGWLARLGLCFGLGQLRQRLFLCDGRLRNLVVDRRRRQVVLFRDPLDGSRPHVRPESDDRTVQHLCRGGCRAVPVTVRPPFVRLPRNSPSSMATTAS